MILEDLTRVSLLCEKYGKLLTQKQIDVIENYVNNNMSFGEIAQQQGITRQAVKDVFSRTVSILNSYEEKLQLLEKEQQTKNLLNNNLSNNEKQLVNTILDIWGE